VKIENQADSMASAQRYCREDEPVWNAIRVHHINEALAVNAEKFTSGQRSEATVLNNVGADPRPLMSLNRLPVELGAVEFATCGIAVALERDDADVPPGGDRGADGATNAWVFIYVRVHHECQVWHESPRLL
jgi:hypothetical protein